MNRARVGAQYRQAETTLVDESAALAVARLTGHGARGLREHGAAPGLYVASLAAGALTAPLLDPELGADLLRITLGAHRFRFLAPVAPGDVLRHTAELRSVDDGPRGEGLTVVATSWRGEEAVLETTVTSWVKGPRRRRTRDDGAPRAGDPFDDATPAAAETVEATSELCQRWAEATGERGALFLDEDHARTADLPGAIVQPLAVLALVLGTMERAPGTPALPSSFTATPARPVRWGDALLVDVRGGSAGRWYARATHPEGVVLVKDVLLEGPR